MTDEAPTPEDLHIRALLDQYRRAQESGDVDLMCSAHGQLVAMLRKPVGLK